MGDEQSPRRLVRVEHSRPELARITVVDWCFGNRCNYACSYCPSHLHDGSVAWESYERIETFCGKLIAHYRSLGRLPFFQFSGGEPTLYPHILELLRHLDSRECKVGLISNGSRRLRWWAAARPFLDSVVLTHHVEFVEIEHFISVVRYLSGAVRTHVNVTMLPSRFDDCLANAGRLAAECENITLTLKPLLVGFGAEMYPYTESQKEVLLRTAWGGARAGDDGEVRGMMRRVYSDGSTDTVKPSHLIVAGENRWAGWSCDIGMELLSIDYNGDVYRGVCRQGGKLGHIGDLDLALPRDPVVCGKRVCHCVTDIMTSRRAEKFC